MHKDSIYLPLFILLNSSFKRKLNFGESFDVGLRGSDQILDQKRAIGSIFSAMSKVIGFT